MRTGTLIFLLMMQLPLAAQEMKIAVVGLVHSHVWGHLKTMVAGEQATLAGVAEPNAELVEEEEATEAADSGDARKRRRRGRRGGKRIQARRQRKKQTGKSSGS